MEKAAGRTALRLLKKIEACADENFSAAAWILERRFPQDFSRPEVQLNLISQSNTVENQLIIKVTGEQIREIESQADPVRQAVSVMFEQYRPSLGNGEKAREIEAEPVLEELQQAAEQAAIIIHKTGHEKSQAFWKMLVTSNPQSLVSKETAMFAVRAILM